MEFSYETGEIKFKEGGVIEEAKLGANFKYPIAGNFIYMTFGLEGSETGTITAKLDSNSLSSLLSTFFIPVSTGFERLAIENFNEEFYDNHASIYNILQALHRFMKCPFFT